MTLLEDLRKRMADADAEEERALAEVVKRVDGWSPEYAEYHEQVVEACAKLMGENQRQFFNEQCDYQEEFERGDEPEDVAWNQWESLT